MPSSDLVRISLNLTRRAHNSLAAVADHTGANNTDSINRAIELYARVVTGDLELVRRTPGGDLEFVILA
jgi:hypothetical protein